LTRIAQWDIAAGPGTSRHDIAPFPWGDGVVDGKDLLVLAEYMVKNVEDVNDVDDTERERR
jgi:hypothetical protein